MFTSDFIVNRDIPPLELDEIDKLIERFNKEHRKSSLKTTHTLKGIITLEYNSRKGLEEIHFKSYRDCERWIRYNHYADCD